MPRRHPQAVPTIQMLAQNAKLDDSAAASRQKYNNINPNSVPAAPTKWDAVYDPENPHADWSGLVGPEFLHQRKHCHDHPSQRSGIEHTEKGLVSRADENTRVVVKDPRIAAMKNATSFTIGAAGGDGGENRWKTNAVSMQAHEGTTVDQLTLQRRMKGVKMIPDPAQSRTRATPGGGGYDSVAGTPRGGFAANTPREDNGGGGAPHAGAPMPARGGNKGLSMADLAKDLAPKLEAPARRTPLDRNIGKTMLLENYNPTPGFTGRRRL